MAKLDLDSEEERSLSSNLGSGTPSTMSSFSETEQTDGTVTETGSSDLDSIATEEAFNKATAIFKNFSTSIIEKEDMKTLVKSLRKAKHRGLLSAKMGPGDCDVSERSGAETESEGASHESG